MSVTLERAAFGLLVLLALVFGLGDIARNSVADTALFLVVRSLVPLTIGLVLLSYVARRRWPAFPSRLARPAAVWLTVLVVSTALAPRFRTEAVASLERP